jgi:hypothetical protein
MAMTMTATMTTPKGWLNHDLSTQAAATVCAVLVATVRRLSVA